jgi:hypothetical protein
MKIAQLLRLENDTSFFLPTWASRSLRRHDDDRHLGSTGQAECRQYPAHSRTRGRLILNLSDSGPNTCCNKDGISICRVPPQCGDAEALPVQHASAWNAANSPCIPKLTGAGSTRLATVTHPRAVGAQTAWARWSTPGLSSGRRSFRQVTCHAGLRRGRQRPVPQVGDYGCRGIAL